MCGAPFGGCDVKDLDLSGAPASAPFRIQNLFGLHVELFSLVLKITKGYGVHPPKKIPSRTRTAVLQVPRNVVIDRSGCRRREASGL
jgi:hypothetical protein